jgi:hypothetical protein
MAGTPVFSEAAGAGGGEDGLAEASEELWDFVEALPTGVDAGEQGVQFGDDPALLGERGQKDS